MNSEMPTPEELHFAAARRSRTMSRMRTLRRVRAIKFGAIPCVVAAAVVLGIALSSSGGRPTRVETRPLAVTSTTPSSSAPTTSTTTRTEAPTSSLHASTSVTDNPRTTPPTSTPSSTSPSITSSTSTSTTVPACDPNEFRPAVTTNRSEYSVGSPIGVTITEYNDGPACVGTPPVNVDFCGGDFEATNEGGSIVWQEGATVNWTGPPQGGSCPTWNSADVVPHGAVTDSSATWNQQECSYDTDSSSGGNENPSCPQTQVAAGSYTLTNSISTTQVTIRIQN